MLKISSIFNQIWLSLGGVARSFNFPVDLIDIAIVAYIIYHAIRLVRETRAMQLLKGIAAILLVYFVAMELNMITLGFFIKNIIQVGIFLLVVLFQPELRNALEKMGRTRLGSFGFGGHSLDVLASEELIDILVDSALDLSAGKTGALMVIERQTKLGDVINTGTLIDSKPSKELIGNIFFVNSPLHDGAMVIRNFRLHAAGCYLPLSQNMGISKELGTRHRAALGMSEVSDAVIVVVSEETGAITVALDSRLHRRLSEDKLRSLLRLSLLGAPGEEGQVKKRKFGFRRAKK